MQKLLLLFTSVVVIVAALFFFTLWTEAQIRAVTVSVDGMACPFCAYGVEKKLKRVVGVESITIDKEVPWTI